jgi:hypothetical protein
MIGQTGRPIVINGPFDGVFGNSTVTVNGRDAFKLAESPRRLVVESPSEVVGPAELMVKEGSTSASGAFRNIAISLAAPKTSLQRGETTKMTVQVQGLEGLTEPLKVRLVNSTPAVVTIEQGDDQTITVTPSDVRSGGAYQTTRSLRGATSGSFGVTATVVPQDPLFQNAPAGNNNRQVVPTYQLPDKNHVSNSKVKDGNLERDCKEWVVTVRVYDAAKGGKENAEPLWTYPVTVRLCSDAAQGYSVIKSVEASGGVEYQERVFVNNDGKVTRRTRTLVSAGTRTTVEYDRNDQKKRATQVQIQDDGRETTIATWEFADGKWVKKSGGEGVPNEPPEPVRPERAVGFEGVPTEMPR